MKNFKNFCNPTSAFNVFFYNKFIEADGIRNACLSRTNILTVTDRQTERLILTISRLVVIQSLVVIFRVDVLCLCDPVQVTLQILLQLLFLSEFLEIPTSFGLLSLFGELSEK